MKKRFCVIVVPTEARWPAAPLVWTVLSSALTLSRSPTWQQRNYESRKPAARTCGSCWFVSTIQCSEDPGIRGRLSFVLDLVNPLIARNSSVSQTLFVRCAPSCDKLHSVVAVGSHQLGGLCWQQPSRNTGLSSNHLIPLPWHLRSCSTCDWSKLCPKCQILRRLPQISFSSPPSSCCRWSPSSGHRGRSLC